VEDQDSGAPSVLYEVSGVAEHGPKVDRALPLRT
jgi:hypothetical protein